jgi:hypothetical protein
VGVRLTGERTATPRRVGNGVAEGKMVRRQTGR